MSAAPSPSAGALRCGTDPAWRDACCFLPGSGNIRPARVRRFCAGLCPPGKKPLRHRTGTMAVSRGTSCWWTIPSPPERRSTPAGKPSGRPSRRTCASPSPPWPSSRPADARDVASVCPAPLPAHGDVLRRPPVCPEPSPAHGSGFVCRMINGLYITDRKDTYNK